MKWFRFHAECLDNPKIQKLSPELFRSWVNLMCVACLDAGYLPSLCDLSFRLRISEDRVEKLLANMQTYKLLDRVEKRLRMHDWEHWQFQSDSSNERVRRFRERQRKQDCNVTGNGFHSGSVSGYGSGSEKQENVAILARYEELVEAGPADRREVDLGCQIWISLVESGEVTATNIADVFAGLERWKTSEQWRKDNGKYVPSIAKWLQKRSWKDYPKQAEVDAW